MKKTIGIGVIGMGWMGMVHSRSYRLAADRFPDEGVRARLVICADDLAERAKTAQRVHRFAEHTTDWREVIDHPEVEAVNVAAPNFLHRPIVRAALEAGKHVFCEKPVGRTPEETLELVELAERARVITGVGFNYRWAPMVQYAHRLVQDGRLGRLTHYRGRFFSMYGSDPRSRLTWRFQQEQAGLGTLGDLMSHAIDMAHFLVGPMRRVIGQQHTFIRERPLPAKTEGTHFVLGSPEDPTGPVTNEDYVGVLVEFVNGARGTLEACRVIFGPQCQMAFELNGTHGALAWDFERLNELQVCLSGGEGAPHGFTRVVAGPDHPFHANFNPGAGLGLGYEDLKVIEAQQFLRWIAEVRQGVPGFAEAKAMAQVQRAIVRSWGRGRWEEIA